MPRTKLPTVAPADAAALASCARQAAALALFRAQGWHERNDLVMGGTKDGYVFVQIPKTEER